MRRRPRSSARARPPASCTVGPATSFMTERRPCARNKLMECLAFSSSGSGGGHKADMLGRPISSQRCSTISWPQLFVGCLEMQAKSGPRIGTSVCPVGNPYVALHESHVFTLRLYDAGELQRAMHASVFLLVRVAASTSHRRSSPGSLASCGNSALGIGAPLAARWRPLQSPARTPSRIAEACTVDVEWMGGHAFTAEEGPVLHFFRWLFLARRLHGICTSMRACAGGGSVWMAGRAPRWV